MNQPGEISVSAIQDFHEARRKAALERILSRLTGRSADLLSYEDVRQKLHAVEVPRQELREIPLEAIVGSVGRYHDFTRSFLPKLQSSGQRWARVKSVSEGAAGHEPIEVYQIGGAYFVKDGNHRVSVARQSDAGTIQAYVTPVETAVPLEADVQPDDLILKAEYADFLESTHLRHLRQGADLALTVPGEYARLEEHIRVHRYFMGLDQRREIPYPEAVAHWYDHVYQPVAEVIRERGLLRDFPDRTEADLYLWVSEHRSALEDEFGLLIDTSEAAQDLAQRFSPRLRRLVERVRESVLDALTPDELARGPDPGRWRLERVEARPSDRLFPEILVAFSGDDSGWLALEQALIVAGREGSAVHGLQVVPRSMDLAGERSSQLEGRFRERLNANGVQGELRITHGRISRRLCEYARWTDLVTLKLEHPPGASLLPRLGSGFRTLLRNCSRPALVVPGQPSPMTHGLLAFDGSDRATEALYVSAYLSCEWGMRLSVVSVQENGGDRGAALEAALDYLNKRGLEASSRLLTGPVTWAIQDHASQIGADLILLGGYGANPVREAVVGSTVEGLLRESKVPLLICR
jgi:nucleotide-binding universal stress UspA family protein